jgi:hypothetical protein
MRAAAKRSDQTRGVSQLGCAYQKLNLPANSHIRPAI